MSRLSRSIVTLFVGIPLLALTTACNGKEQAVAPKTASSSDAYTVSAAQVSRQSLSGQVVAVGTVMPWQEIILSAQAGGFAVIEVRVGENDRVAKGDIIVRLDDRILNAQIAQQRALMAEAQANLDAASQKVASANLLVTSQAISKEMAEERRTAVRTSQAKLDQAKAVLEQLQTQQDQTLIVAPVNGYISQKPVVIGTIPQPGMELVRIIRDSRLEIEARIPEQDIGSVREGQIARVIGADGQEIEVRVRSIAAKVDAKTRLGLVYVTLPAGADFRPGMFARVNIEIPARATLAVPEQALIWREGKPTVFVLDSENRAILTSVSTGIRQSGLVAIEDGLKDTDRIVVAGAGFVNDGDRVRVAVSAAPEAKAEQVR